MLGLAELAFVLQGGELAIPPWLTVFINDTLLEERTKEGFTKIHSPWNTTGSSLFVFLIWEPGPKLAGVLWSVTAL